jgi:wyosine [tRNA(Phe)-imidazoG37] synthetase (radical SAM superfamily)
MVRKLADQCRYSYGPVPSRRLGLSLGLDIIPAKVCTLDCVYCQLGKTTNSITRRKNFVDVGQVLTELREKLAEGVQADYITISGSGEPTLHAQLGKLIYGVKEITSIPVAILTNGTLLYRKEVRSDCARADVVLPSLDAGDEETFQKVNRPHRDISIEKLISGLCAFRNVFAGQMWLEVFLVKGLNTDSEQITKIKKAVEQIRPDKVQLNTAVRPTADPTIERLSSEELQVIAAQIGPSCEVVTDFVVRHHIRPDQGSTMEALLSMLKRRPCSLRDICSGLDIGTDRALGYLIGLQKKGLITSEEQGGILFYRAIH